MRVLLSFIFTLLLCLNSFSQCEIEIETELPLYSCQDISLNIGEIGNNNTLEIKNFTTDQVVYTLSNIISNSNVSINLSLAR